MKKRDVALGLALALSTLMVSCSKSDDVNLLKQSKSTAKEAVDPAPCDEWITFVDAGMCGGVWFKNAAGTYLEVYGLTKTRDELDLEVGDRIAVSYESYTYEGIACQAMTDAEMEIYESGDPRETVTITCQKSTEEENTGSCDEWIEFVDAGMCGGVWFKNASGTYLEVYGLSKARDQLNLEVGDKITVSYEAYIHEAIVCHALTDAEHEIFQSGNSVETVRITCEAENTTNEECDEKVVFMDGGLCGGIWFQRTDGTYLEVYDYPFDRENPSLTHGDVVTLSYENVDVSTFIRCQALNDFESGIYSGLNDIEIVTATCH